MLAMLSLISTRVAYGGSREMTYFRSDAINSARYVENLASVNEQMNVWVNELWSWVFVCARALEIGKQIIVDVSCEQVQSPVCALTIRMSAKPLEREVLLTFSRVIYL